MSSTLTLPTRAPNATSGDDGANARGKSAGRVAVGVLALGVAFGIKALYSRAGADQLGWVLQPSCWLAELLGPLEFSPEPGAGFISHAAHMVVGPACAGVNFFVVATLALYFGSQGRFASARDLALWLAISVGGAYVATVATNALRIDLAARLYAVELDVPWLTKARVHRLLGLVLYSAALLVLCALAGRLGAMLAATRVPTPSRSGDEPAPLAPRPHPTSAPRALHARLAPCYWYIGVMVGIPLANRRYAHAPERFVEHTLWVVGVTLVLAVIAQLAARMRDRLQSVRRSDAQAADLDRR